MSSDLKEFLSHKKALRDTLTQVLAPEAVGYILSLVAQDLATKKAAEFYSANIDI